MQEELITVIVPIYNVEKYLPFCLDSILRQTYKNFEALLINDGTADNSQKIIDEYCLKDERFKSFIKENGGLSDARNYGLNYAKGQYIFFLDSDDYLEDDCLEKLYIKIKKEEVDLVLCGYNICFEDGEIKEVLSNYQIEKNSYLKSHDLLIELPHCAWNKLYKKKLFEKIRFPKGLYYEDSSTSAMIYLVAQKIAYLNIPLINYRLDRKGNITSKTNKKILDIFENLKITLDFYKKLNMFQEYYDVLERYSLVLIFDLSYKFAGRKNDALKKEFLDKAFCFLNENFKNWKKSKYFNSSNFKKIIFNKMKKNKVLYSFILGRKKL